jgi:DNA invertase Pin-like site-specific DNA recombinase
MKIGEQLAAIKRERDAAIIRLLQEGVTHQRTAELVGTSMSTVERLAKSIRVVKP